MALRCLKNHFQQALEPIQQSLQLLGQHPGRTRVGRCGDAHSQERTSARYNLSTLGCRADGLFELHPSDGDVYNDLLRPRARTFWEHRPKWSAVGRICRLGFPVMAVTAVAKRFSLRSTGMAMALSRLCEGAADA